MEETGVKEPRSVKLAISERSFSIDFDLHDDELIDAFLTMVKVFVTKRSSVKVTYTYGSSLSSSTQIITKLISNVGQAKNFINEINQLLYIVRKSI
jgi:hypothetical protein